MQIQIHVHFPHIVADNHFTPTYQTFWLIHIKMKFLHKDWEKIQRKKSIPFFFFLLSCSSVNVMMYTLTETDDK